ncbi:hypothetical protein OCU04_007939 [Sclerotinia nivalis]|uniref:Uncharacterized protein n=1 Tax=Sclerotinia nivalis TaxID=352851 RepID=A0A9X0AKQ2_9HELO|nr:hypothetical protein OCU04_007939 [Sclerotinia nivalis]
MRLAKNDPNTFLYELFCNENGDDEGGPPIELEGLDGGYRAGLHHAAIMFGLFHSTSVSDIMVIGSKKNNLAAERLKALNLEARWPGQPSHASSGTRKRRAQDEDEDQDEEVPFVGVAEEARQRTNAQARLSSSSNHAGVARQASARLQQTRADEIKRVKKTAARVGGFISAADRARLQELGVSQAEIGRISTKGAHSLLAEINQYRLGYADADENEDEDDEDEDNDVEDEDDHNEGPWDVTGHWKIECRDLRRNYGHRDPYILQIFSSNKLHRNGTEMYGRLCFQEWKGIIRFSSMRSVRDDHQDQYILDANDQISAEDPTRCYRWRGKDIQDIIQLNSDSKLYRMTFSNGGKNVEGTWGHDDGNVKFTGVKLRDARPGEGRRILYDWDKHYRQEYDRANRERWR